MNYNKRHLARKQKTEQYLQQLVDESNNTSRSFTPQAKKTVSKPAAPSPAPVKKVQKKKSAAKPSKKTVKKAINLADTIENYRSMPMSKKKKKRRDGIFYTIIGVIAVGLLLFTSSLFFKVQDFSINGSLKYGRDKIISASEIETDTNLFKIKPKEVALKIEQALPYVKEATVKRSLTGTVEINIVETKGMAAVAFSGGFVVIDENSKMLDITTTADELTQITGAVIASPITLGNYAEYTEETAKELINTLITAFEKQGIIEGVNSVNIEKRYNISYVYKENITCVLGDISELETKLGMIKVVSEKNSENIKAQIDATDPNKVYYRPEN